MSKGDLLEQPSLQEQEEYFKRILKELQLEGIVSVGKSKVCPGKGNNIIRNIKGIFWTSVIIFTLEIVIRSLLMKAILSIQAKKSYVHIILSKKLLIQEFCVDLHWRILFIQVSLPNVTLNHINLFSKKNLSWAHKIARTRY